LKACRTTILDGALPELSQKKTATELVNLCRNTPDRALALIRQALGKAAAGSTCHRYDWCSA
jgi:hypothetical protein